MAKLYFFFATMYAGKSGIAINKYDTAKKQHKKVLAFTTEEDWRAKELEITDKKSIITTRQNQKKDKVYAIDAYIIERVDLYKMVEKIKPDIIIVDEVQFIKRSDIIYELARIVDELNIPVNCYGLKNDFQLNTFPASGLLINIADKVIEIETTCSFCNRKAIANLRTITDEEDVAESKKIYTPVFSGEQKELEKGKTRYFQTCRKEYFEIKKLQENGEKVTIKNFKIRY